MNFNIFWGLYILCFGLIIIFVWYFLYFKKRNRITNCSEKIIGKITRYSLIKYNDISLPVVEYYVDNNKYEVVGPKFTAVVKKYFKSPTNNIKSNISSNLNTREDLPKVLKLNVKENSFVNVRFSPLLDLYPIGSEVDVYYNPKKPKESYVQRFIKPSKIYYLLLILGIILIIVSICIFFGPKITMK